jgi:L-seryl-tRNA(Ser) seleniumtransferase
MTPSQHAVLRSLPNVHECINTLVTSERLSDIPLKRIKFCTRLYLETLRQALLAGQDVQQSLVDKERLIEEMVTFVRRYHQPHFIRVINGTGIIVHTNLGRSLLPSTSIDTLISASRGYCNLELNLETGKRGSRYQHVEALLCELTGAESALVVNNNAAAVLLSLDSLARGKEVIVSRGQLVEIGGSFRIPDIMQRSGAQLIEVGTTNRTHYYDYQNAITNETGLLLRVHCSNYRVIGFTSEVSNAELAQLGKAHSIPVMEDLGSGCLVDLSCFGLAKEPLVQEAVASGIDVVTFSGDKLLGGPQAGIIVGKKAFVEPIKKNPLNRALRIDKMTLAALESVLRLYLDEKAALQEIPTLAMITASEGTIRLRAERVVEQCAARMKDLGMFSLVPTASQIGGGAMPEQNLPSWAMAVQPVGMKASQLGKRLRQATVPVLARMESDCLLIDMRTVAEDEIDILMTSLHSALTGTPH